eukprot:CAMPEP_0178872944 /NCGR_PEP_ID=MMETSP0747-20121128/8404_1 /TAXON_ID=913974 /ORGANISM="Nitzschia punctata, Strain CCMP561" /LENGTH=462 /DNA_ID=CAMNT_0020540213 /DNA_START=29 /DNA_END=1417 /DNA_ORIENTATION=-
MGMMGLREAVTNGVYYWCGRTSSTANRGPVLVEASRKIFFRAGESDVSSCKSSVDDGRETMNNDRKRSLLSMRNGAESVLLTRTKATKATTPFQHRSRSFWTWRGGEAAGDESTTTTFSKASRKESLAASKAGRKKYLVSFGTEQGFRSYMEDEYFISEKGDFAAVFDGHGGRAVSKYLRKNLYANVQAFLPLAVLKAKEATKSDQEEPLESEQKSENEGVTVDLSTPSSLSSTTRLVSNPTVADYASALESALDKVDNEILKISHWSFQGSTAVVVWIHEERIADNERVDETSSSRSAVNRTILAANIGDSRAVLCRNDTACELTRDHKPNDPTEKERIEKLGGHVIWCGDTDSFGMPIEERGVYRVNGNLALSRAIGDRSERPHVTAQPEMIAVPVVEDDQFIIIATDGLWDVMESAESVGYVKYVLNEGLPREKVAAQMVQEALRRGTYDNVTVVIIWL